MCVDDYDQVLHVGGDSRAQAVLTAAYRYIQQRAALLDPDARMRYLTAVAANRKIMELWQEGDVVRG